MVNSRKSRLCSTESPLQEVKHLEGENLQALQKGFCIRWLKRTDNSQLEIQFSSRSLATQMEKELRVQFIFYEHYCDGEVRTIPKALVCQCDDLEIRT